MQRKPGKKVDHTLSLHLYRANANLSVVTESRSVFGQAGGGQEGSVTGGGGVWATGAVIVILILMMVSRVSMYMGQN